MTLRYIMNTRDDASPEKLKEIVDKAVSKKIGGAVMTVAEQLIKKGKEEGIQLGREKGIEKGQLIGDIRFSELMKGLPVTDKKELEKLSTDELQTRLKEIK